MVSNADVSQEVVDAFGQVRSKALRWVVARVEDTAVVLEATGARESTLEELQAAVGNEPRYIVYDFEHTKDDGVHMTKTCFIAYSPDSCTNIQSKFALQNFKRSAMSKIQAHKEMQINDKSDIKVGEFLAAFNLD